MSSDTDLPIGPRVTLNCPICGDEVEMEETSHHNLHVFSGDHQPPSPEDPDLGGCPVSYARADLHIRQNYSFVNHHLPSVFLTVPHQVEDDDVLETALSGMDDQNCGVALEILRSDDFLGFAYAWRFNPGPTYYAVIREIDTPTNVLASYGLEDLQEFMTYWFEWDPHWWEE